MSFRVKPTFTLLPLMLLCVVMQTSSCAAQVTPSLGDGGAKLSGKSEPALLVLGGSEDRVKLCVSTVSISGRTQPVGAVTLRAFDEVLLSGGADNSASESLPGWRGNSLWLDGQSVAATGTNDLRVSARFASNDWEYASIDLAPSWGTRVKKFARRLLYVQPDLIVICDDVVLAEPAAVETGWWFPEGIALDSVRDEWRLQLARAGLTARFFASPGGRPQVQALSDSASANPTSVASRVVQLRAGVTNKLSEYRQLTVLVPHEKVAKRSLAFKLLESDTAIGLRVHRDGLPTLVAFHKNPGIGEANLTGMKFTAPVAVDVFRPKRPAR